MTYSRKSPSQRYTDHLEIYKSMHVDGYERKADGQTSKIEGKDAYPGEQLLKFRLIIKEMIDKTSSKTILDYGCGKGQQYGPLDVPDQQGKIVAKSIQEYWDVKSIRMFDPGVKEHSTLPEGKYDGVVSTDVLEHIPIEDIPWVVEEMCSYARKFVFANIACYPALATLPDGSNAHVTIKHPEWWDGLFTALTQNKRSLKYAIVCAYPQQQPDGTHKMAQSVHTNLD